MKPIFTNRGFVRYEFDDRYGEPCSLQESSLAFEDAIWLGTNKDGNRMHLTKEHVAEILPILQHFMDTGKLPRPE